LLLAKNVCSFCDRPKTGKLANAYWSWYLADGERVCWRLLYCPEHAAEHLFGSSSVLRMSAETSETFACLSCGGDVSQDSDPVWLTLFLPGKERMDFALQLDGACAARMRIPLTTTGRKQASRPQGSGGGAPRDDPWAAMGIAPRMA
jgi:hypothetical protein